MTRALLEWLPAATVVLSFGTGLINFVAAAARGAHRLRDRRSDRDHSA
ncbi:hypothetical protein ACWEOZ_02475 [Actinoplanes sp. NPDC004185]